MLARLTEKKGVRYLIDAMPQILKELPGSKLLIVGSGELEKELKGHVVTLGLSNHVRFTGSVCNNDLPEFYATADIFIGPSIEAKSGDTEGFGLTFVESAMSGCLVIGTKTGGIGDIIQDNETGLIVPEKNANALAEKIIYAFEHEKEIQKIKKAARNRCIEKYDWTVITKRYENLFVQLIK